MNFLLVLFLSVIRSLNDFSNFQSSNGQELVSSTSQSSQTHEKIRYDHFTVYGIKLRNEQQGFVLKRLTDSGENYDLWLSKGDSLHIMVNPKRLGEFQKLTRIGRIHPEILIENVQKLIDEEEASQRRQPRQSFSWNRYHTLDEINNWLLHKIAEHSQEAEHFSIGTSTEGRTIHGIKISHKANNPGIFIESHIHAREWITSATATWIINELLTSKQTKVRYFAENYDWYILPVLNVDGFVYSHERDRLWRKTRSRHTNNSNLNCIGVDGNRNYNSHWMENGGATSNPCYDTYAGPYPFSEPEIHGLANYVQSIKNKLNIMLAFHSYGQNLLSPYGYTVARKPDNFGNLMQIATAFSDTVANLTYHTKYHNGTTAETLYLASGSTTDWAYDQGIRISYTIEFRDKGQYGFLLPSSEIIPNSVETLAGLFAMITEADNLGYMNLKQAIQSFNIYRFLSWPRF